MTGPLVFITIFWCLIPTTAGWLAAFAHILDRPSAAVIALVLASGVGLFSAWRLVFTYHRFTMRTIPKWMWGGLIVGTVTCLVLHREVNEPSDFASLILWFYPTGTAVFIPVLICLTAIRAKSKSLL